MTGSNTFLKFADEDGDPFYVRASSIDSFGVSDAAGATTLIVNGSVIECLESTETIIDALGLDIDIIEVEPA